MCPKNSTHMTFFIVRLSNLDILVFWYKSSICLNFYLPTEHLEKKKASDDLCSVTWSIKKSYMGRAFWGTLYKGYLKDKSTNEDIS